jgi:hypothetical protein
MRGKVAAMAAVAWEAAMAAAMREPVIMAARRVLRAPAP